MNRNPLRDAIVANLALGDAAQQGGGRNNALQPARGLLPCSGQEPVSQAPMPDDGPCHGNEPATPEEDADLPGGALPGETDYLDAHDLIDWELAPFAATSYGAFRANSPDAEVIGRWLWVGEDGRVTGVPAPKFAVVLDPGRALVLRHPGIDAPSVIERLGLVAP